MNWLGLLNAGISGLAILTGLVALGYHLFQARTISIEERERRGLDRIGKRAAPERDLAYFEKHGHWPDPDK
jgi:hypothetical protein